MAGDYAYKARKFRPREFNNIFRFLGIRTKIKLFAHSAAVMFVEVRVEVLLDLAFKLYLGRQHSDCVVTDCTSLC